MFSDAEEERLRGFPEIGLDAQSTLARSSAASTRAGFRWWPPTANPVWLDFVLEITPASG